MEVDTDDDLLRTLADGGSIDYAHWPRVLNTLVSRIESNCYNCFAIPVIPPPRRTQSVFTDWTSTVRSDIPSTADDRAPGPSASGTAPRSSVPQEEVDKENTEPASESASAEEIEDVTSSAVGQETITGTDSAKAADDAPAATTAAPTSTSDDASKPPAPTSTAMPPPPTPASGDAAGAASAPAATEPPTMPEPAVELIEYITSHLKTTFPKYPPHSIQRLSELVVCPYQHYRYLGPYLHALERVVSVTSGSNRYPLPSELPPSQAAILNGTATLSNSGRASSQSHENGTNGGEAGKGGSAVGAPAESTQDWSSDTSWGALLTPIPWLRGQQPNNNSNTDDDRSTTEEAGGEGGSSPLDGSDDDGSEIAFSTTSSTAGGASLSIINTSTRDDIGGVRDSHSPSRSPSPSHGMTSLQQQQQQLFQQTPQAQSSLQSQQPQQRRLEVRTEATETIDGPNGVGSIETVSVSINGISSHGTAAAAVVHLQQRGITQGELLRQEQKAGVVPVSQLARAAAAARAAGSRYDRYVEHDDDDEEPEEDEDHEMEDSAQSRAPFTDEASSAADTAMGGTAGDKDAAESSNTANEAEANKENGANEAAEGEAVEEDEIPHARGPLELGAADMGPQPDSSSTSAPDLQIGSAADASAVHTVHMDEMNLESAVGRPADELPAGSVAAPLVPSLPSAPSASSASTVATSIVDSTEVPDKEDAAPTGTAPSSVLSPARATTPKREADQSLDAALPAKKRKGGGSDDGKGGKATDGDKAAEADAVPEASRDDAGPDKQ
ncbi:protein phosphatase 4 core regulatory subunit r2 [Ophiostoma piceae UAMH 11346]|uniref:Protein phosphatase 4 core regulatory subunit r2 n=1 Tax=Ophiostoma piceae (strain UAMH 11346) TaxID=1262450 RepID=S3D836_OPHP1|nr:protein phosphatase 4 core regulatory subunit r2 [Ophiostoma piceae UAMH 11346]